MEMPEAATACTSCGRRPKAFNVTAWTAPLSLVVAILSLSIAATPILSDAALPRRPVLKVSMLGMRSDGAVEISVENGGHERGILRAATITFQPPASPVPAVGKNPNAADPVQLAFSRSENPSDFRISKSRELRTIVGRLDRPPAQLAQLFEKVFDEDQNNADSWTCELNVQFDGFGGGGVAKSPIACPDLRPALWAAYSGSPTKPPQPRR